MALNYAAWEKNAVSFVATQHRITGPSEGRSLREDTMLQIQAGCPVLGLFQP